MLVEAKSDRKIFLELIMILCALTRHCNSSMLKCTQTKSMMKLEPTSIPYMIYVHTYIRHEFYSKESYAYNTHRPTEQSRQDTRLYTFEQHGQI